MEKSIIKIIIIMIFIFLGISCSEKKEENTSNVVVIPTNPYNVTGAEADWLIMMDWMTSEESKNNNLLSIKVKYLKNPSHTFTNSDEAVLLVNDAPIVLTLDNDMEDNYSFYYEGLSVEIGSTLDLRFKFNGKEKFHNSIKVPYPAIVNFPSTYNPDTVQYITWTVQNNQYQFAKLTTFQPGAPSFTALDYSHVLLNPEVRIYYFPIAMLAQSTSELAQTGYRMSLSEATAKIFNKCLVWIQHTAYKDFFVINSNEVPYQAEQITGQYCDGVIVFDIESSNKKKNTSSLIVKFLNSNLIPTSTDTVKFIWSGNDIILQNIENSPYYYAYTEFNAGANIVFDFMVNNVIRLHSNMIIPYPAQVIFPENYTPNSPCEINWTLKDDNEYQFLTLDSFYDDGTINGLHSTYFRRLPAYIRSHYIPINAVQNYGAGTEYTLYLKQMNYNVVQRYALMGITDIEHTYYSEKSKTNQLVM